MEFLVIALIAFGASILTFFSGFGLGTILLPAFALFFPVHIAIAMTGIVHFLNNIFKMVLVAKNTNFQVLIRFGLPAMIASFVGASLLLTIEHLPSIYSYNLFDKQFEITPIKLIISIILLIFSILEFIPKFKNLQFDKNKLIYGGLLSGFFGGLSGIQGALRTAFLVKSGLSKEAFIATGVVIASLIDISRLSVYISRFDNANLMDNIYLLILAIISAILGAIIGNKLLKKVTMKSIQIVVAIMLIIISVLMGAGVI